MCGRFTLNKTGQDLAAELPGFKADLKVQPRYNIAPSQPLASILNDGSDRMTFTQWGLIPHWAKDPSIGMKMINARSETVFEKPSFRTPIKRKRCLIVADGWYEWKKVAGQNTKQPMYFHFKHGRAFCFAGLWDEWHDREGGLLLTSTILTCQPNALTKTVHHRMPVILHPEHWKTWLSNKVDKPAQLNPIMAPCPADELEMHAVSTHVNSARNDDPRCIEPTGQTEFPL